jgi:hypothetical protein
MRVEAISRARTTPLDPNGREGLLLSYKDAYGDFVGTSMVRRCTREWIGRRSVIAGSDQVRTSFPAPSSK